MTRFDGKVAIITGGAGGIGSATCRRFAAEGARVAVFDRDEAGAKSLASEITAAGGTAQAFACDITDRKSVDAAIAATESRSGRSRFSSTTRASISSSRSSRPIRPNGSV